MEKHGRNGIDDVGRLVARSADAFSFCGPDSGRADWPSESAGGGDHADAQALPVGVGFSVGGLDWGRILVASAPSFDFGRVIGRGRGREWGGD
jgi:hypothetical protein